MHKLCKNGENDSRVTLLPGLDGPEICREIPGFSQVPITMVTARVEEIDRLLGLDLGADDSICKPYGTREIVARAKAVLRRTVAVSAPPAGPPLGRGRLQIRANDRDLELTAMKFALLQTLYTAPERIFFRGWLMEQIYSDNRVVADRTIDSHVKKLRHKLADLLPDRELIQAVYGVGYRDEDNGTPRGSDRR